MAKRRRPTRKINFTKRTLQSLPAPPVETTVFDSTPGLGLLLYPSGTRSFFHLRIARGKPRRTTIGKFPEFTVDQARGKASDLNSMLAKWKLNNFLGDDPFEKRGNPLDMLVEAYVQKHVMSRAAHPDRASKSLEWQVKNIFRPGGSATSIRFRKTEVQDLHDRLGEDVGHHTANRTVELVRRLFNWAAEAGMWHGANPAARIKFFYEAKRTRFLQPDELPRFFRALAKEKNIELRDFVNLAMRTGARRGDILSMRWENVSLEDNRWQVPEPKGRVPYRAALTPEATEILKSRKKRVEESPWVFPSRGKTGHLVDMKIAWRKLLKRANVAGLRQHDLRRTLGSDPSSRAGKQSENHRRVARPQIHFRHAGLRATESRSGPRLGDGRHAHHDCGLESESESESPGPRLSLWPALERGNLVTLGGVPPRSAGWFWAGLRPDDIVTMRKFRLPDPVERPISGCVELLRAAGGDRPLSTLPAMREALLKVSGDRKMETWEKVEVRKVWRPAQPRDEQTEKHRNFLLLRVRNQRVRQRSYRRGSWFVTYSPPNVPREKVLESQLLRDAGLKRAEENSRTVAEDYSQWSVSVRSPFGEKKPLLDPGSAAFLMDCYASDLRKAYVQACASGSSGDIKKGGGARGECRNRREGIGCVRGSQMGARDARKNADSAERKSREK